MKKENVHIVFADETSQPTENIDPSERSQESLDREKIYDDEISPLVKQLIEKCKEHGMPLFVECEYSTGDFCKTIIYKGGESHPVFATFDAITQCIQSDGINLDKYLKWIIKMAEEAGGHDSIYLSMLGIRAETGIYDGNLRYNMALGAKPKES